jgi:DNA-binding NtrC family response regulator
MSESPVSRLVVLLVEDDAAVRDVIARFLGTHGYEVVAAETAEEALELVEVHRVQILLSDIVLPGLDGFNMAAEMVRRSHRMRMHFMSGQFDVSMALAAGWAAETPVLRKPFALVDLLALLRDSIPAAEAPEPRELAAVCDLDEACSMGPAWKRS